MLRLAILLLLLAPTVAASSDPLEVTLAMNEKWEKPQKVVIFPAEVANRGAASTRVTFEIASNPQDATAVIPNPVTIPAGETRTITFAVHTPFRNGYVNDEARVTYRATSAEGSASEFDVIVHTRGMYVPGPQIFGAMLAIAFAAFLLRRR